MSAGRCGWCPLRFYFRFIYVFVLISDLPDSLAQNADRYAGNVKPSGSNSPASRAVWGQVDWKRVDSLLWRRIKLSAFRENDLPFLPPPLFPNRAPSVNSLVFQKIKTWLSKVLWKFANHCLRVVQTSKGLTT